MHRIVKKRMEVEQDVDAGLGNRANVPEYVLGFGIDELRFQGDIELLRSDCLLPAYYYCVNVILTQ